MLRLLATLAVLGGACILPSQRPVAPETPAPADAGARAEDASFARQAPEETGLAAVQRQLRPLRSVPEDLAAVPAEARPYLRAVRAGLRAWLLDEVARAGAVPPRALLRATLDHAEVTATRAGEELQWGPVTRIDVLAPGEDLTAVVIGVRLACTSDDAVYVFRGGRLVIELAQDRWAELTDARADVRVLQSRAARTGGVLLVSSLSQRCASRWQFVRFEGVTEGGSPERPTSRWDLRQSVDTQGECGGYDPASLGIELSRNGFEIRGCHPSPTGAAREVRTRYRYTRDGIEPAVPPAR